MKVGDLVKYYPIGDRKKPSLHIVVRASTYSVRLHDRPTNQLFDKNDLELVSESR